MNVGMGVNAGIAWSTRLPARSDSISPTQILPLVTAPLSISGDHMTGVTSVEIDGTPATLVVVASDTMITFVSPSMLAGARSVVVKKGSLASFPIALTVGP